jgi:hypothetical protein
MSELAGETATARLAGLWGAVDGEGQPPSATVMELPSGGEMVVISVPGASPSNPGDAPLIAMLSDGNRHGYYTLEHGVDLGDGPITMLCEWDAAGRHFNHGVGPAPEPELFTRAVLALIAN